MKSEEIWNSIKEEIFSLSVQDVYMLLNVVCLVIFVYYLICVLLGIAPKEKKPDPTILKAYSFGHWWLWILLGVANLSQRIFGITLFAIPTERLKELVRDTPEEAQELFGSSETTIELYDTIIDDLANSKILSSYGRYMAMRDLTSALLARKHFMEYIVAHPEVLEQKVDEPIVITGLPRSGMHLLYNLLALDPTLRAPRHYEAEAMAYTPIDPPKAGAVDTEHVWHNRSYHAWQSIYRLTPELYEELVACQYMDPISFCDDSIIAQHVAPAQTYATILGDHARRMLISLPNAKNVYTYIYRYLQMLQTAPVEEDAVETKWLLKAPLHASHLPQLLQTFPKARVVVMHRKMTEVVPSSATYLLRVMHPALKGQALDKKHLGKVALNLCSEKAAAMAEFRKKEHDFIDIEYSDLAADPIETVKALYAKWNRPVSDDFIEKMNSYLADKPKGKYGELKYTLEEFGLSQMVIDSLFAKYDAKEVQYHGECLTVPGSPLTQSA